MAKIKLKGQQELLSVPNDQAKTLQRDFLNNTLPEVVKIGGHTFQKSLLVSIQLDNEEDIKPQFTEQELKEFEKEISVYRSERTYDEKAIQSFDRSAEKKYLLDKGIITLNKQGFWSIKDIPLYEKFTELREAYWRWTLSIGYRNFQLENYREGIVKTMPKVYEE